MQTLIELQRYEEAIEELYATLAIVPKGMCVPDE